MGSFDEVVVVGLGQIGSEIAEGLRACGIALREVHRDQLGLLAELGSSRAVVLAVPEDALADVAGRLPIALRSRAVLVQNELASHVWRDAGLVTPTVAVVWFEKKGGRAPRPVLATPVGGPNAQLVVEALARQSLPAEVVELGAPLVRALVAKNLYIVVSNLAGLAAQRSGPVSTAPAVSWPTGASTMGELLDVHATFARALGQEIFAIERARVDAEHRDAMDFDAAWDVFVAATRADPTHACIGRSAPARLARATARSRELGVSAPIVDALAGPS